MVHYKSEILLINNLEFDHADIFDSLTDIEWQFHQTIRTMAQNAHVIHLSSCAAIRAVLQRGCWSKTSSFGLDDHSDWQLCRKPSIAQADEFRTPEGTYINCPPSLIGQHNALNGLAAVAIAQHVGVVAEQAVDALTQYQGVRRRLEYLGTLAKRPFYSDFAHHPTAISCIIDTLNQRHPGARIGVLMELGSHTQRRADMVQAHRLALQSVAFVLLLQPEGMVLTDHGLHPNGQVFASKKHLLDSIQQDVYACDIWLLLSSRSLGGALDGLSFDVPSCVDSADILD